MHHLVIEMKTEGWAISGGSQKGGDTEELPRSGERRQERSVKRGGAPFASAAPAVDALPEPATPSPVVNGKGNGKGNGKKKRNGVKTEEQLRAAILKVKADSSRRVLKLAEGQDPADFARAYASASVVQLFDSWAPDYDLHMHSTGHDPASQNLLQQAAILDKRSRESHGWPIFGRRLIEMSCGTGTQIKFLSEIIPPEDFAQMRVIANDISPQMQGLAKVKLEGLGCRVDYTSFDIREMPFGPGSFDTGMIVNTIPFLTDPKLLLRENEDGFEKSEHRHVKTLTLKRAMDVLPWNGHLIVIDEWPAKYTSRGTTIPPQSVIRDMFDDNARPINERSTFRDKVMKNVPGARFVAELKARIDRDHSMYIFIYRKDEDKVRNRYLYLPDDEATAARVGMDLEDLQSARREAMDRVIDTFKAIDPLFVRFYQPINGERLHWAEFLPVGEGPVFDSRDPSTAVSLGDRYNTAILAGILHSLSDEQRMLMIRNVVNSLNSGGSIMFIDEWDPPSSSPNPIQKRTLRDTVIEAFHQQLLFQGALRETVLPGYDSGIYGYLFRKKF